MSRMRSRSSRQYWPPPRFLSFASSMVKPLTMYSRSRSVAHIRNWVAVPLRTRYPTEMIMSRLYLDMIISVGYRVRSGTATQFRMWATERLREYIVKGFIMDDAKLKNLGGGQYWRELLERIRDIRSSEKVLYRQVLDLYATSVDYDADAPETTEFFKIVQNKLHYAAHG